MDDTQALRVAVYADGRLAVDGMLSSFNTLQNILDSLHAQGGVVLYYGEASPDCSPTAMRVLRALGNAGLMIRFSGKATFSDLLKSGTNRPGGKKSGTGLSYRRQVSTDWPN